MGEYTETESRLVAGKGWKKRKQEVTANGFGVSFGGDENTLKLITVRGVQLCE